LKNPESHGIGEDHKNEALLELWGQEEGLDTLKQKEHEITSRQDIFLKQTLLNGVKGGV